VKFNADKTSSRRKMRKAHFAAPSHEKRIRMSSGLTKELFQRHNVSYYIRSFFSMQFLLLRLFHTSVAALVLTRTTIYIPFYLTFPRSAPSPSERTTRSELSVESSPVRRARSPRFTERSTLSTSRESPAIRPTVRPSTLASTPPTSRSPRSRWTSPARKFWIERTARPSPPRPLLPKLCDLYNLLESIKPRCNSF
jgi:hypothetical protein